MACLVLDVVLRQVVKVFDAAKKVLCKIGFLHQQPVEDASVTTNIKDIPLLYPPKDYAAPSVFTVENVIEVGRQKPGVKEGQIPAVCVLDPDGEILRDLQGKEKSETWPCYYTQLWVAKFGKREVGIVPFTIGSPLAVLVADELYACGCQFVIHFTSAQRVEMTEDGIEPERDFYVLIEKALRDEGTSLHWQPASIWSHAPTNVLAKIPDEVFKNLKTKVIRGKSWTRDSLRSSDQKANQRAIEERILCVEMESAALYAFANHRGRPLVSFAHVEPERQCQSSLCTSSQLIESVCNAWFENSEKSKTHNIALNMQNQELGQMVADKSPLIMHATNRMVTNMRHPRISCHPHEEIPHVCVISPEGDIFGDLKALENKGQAKKQELSQHSNIWVIPNVFHNGCEKIGFVPNIVGGPFAVLTADMLFERGCKLMIHLCNGAEVASPGRDLAKEQSFFVLVEEALRDEGTSLHWQPPSRWSTTSKRIMEKLKPLTQNKDMRKRVICGRSWTLDCPFRETQNAIDLAKAQKIVCVEMESAALMSYAYAHPDRGIVSFVMVQNSEANTEDDEESGMNDGPEVFLELVQKVAENLR